MINWIRQNFMVLIFLLAIGGSFIVAADDARQRDKNLVTAAVSVCERTSNGTAYDVVFKFHLADDARAAGKDKLASDIESFARGKLRTLPAPPRLGNKEKDLRTLVDTEERDGRLVLTKEAARLQKVGCKTLFN